MANIRPADLGYNGFLTRTIPASTKISSLETNGMYSPGSLSALQLSTPLNATTDIVFSSTDYNTAAWTAGTIYFADGSKTDVITMGNTGDIVATTYVYYDKEVPLILSTTTDHSRAVGATKLLIAIVELGVSGKDCKITPTIAAGLNVSGITANQIEANTITANELATNSVTAEKINVTQLDAVATNTGTLIVNETITVGLSNVLIDGENKRILINDGTNDRVLLGYQSSGF